MLLLLLLHLLLLVSRFVVFNDESRGESESESRGRSRGESESDSDSESGNRIVTGILKWLVLTNSKTPEDISLKFECCVECYAKNY